MKHKTIKIVRNRYLSWQVPILILLFFGSWAANFGFGGLDLFRFYSPFIFLAYGIWLMYIIDNDDKEYVEELEVKE